MTLPALPPSRRPTARAAERLRTSTASPKLPPRRDPATRPALYGDDVSSFLRRRRVLQAAFADAYDRREASTFLYEKAERLAGVLLGINL